MDSQNQQSQKSALVVDDSKLARYVLKEMLVAHAIKVDTAESAEEALGILSAYKPDVIFMDHMMPGMDGFQAVQAIKNDPSTAKIPILMYTSKDEGVYVNQARALGAVGVLPKKLKPVQLERVLQQLKLIPFNSNERVAKAAVPTPDKVSEAQAEIISETRHTLEELARSASEDLEKDSMRQLFRQLFIEQRDSIKQDQHALLATMLKEVKPAVAQIGKQTLCWQKWGVGLTVALFIGAASLWLSRADVLTPKIDMIAKMQTDNNKKSDALLDKLNQPMNTSPAKTDTVFPTQLLQWTLNQNNQLAYQEPLTSLRMQNHMTELLMRLEQEGFNGTLNLRYHSGRYCEKNTSGVFSLANQKTPISQCKNRSDLEWADASQAKDWGQLVDQWNNTYNGFYIEFEYMGSSYTQQEYPVVITSGAATTLSKDWNAAAAVNHRLEFNFQ